MESPASLRGNAAGELFFVLGVGHEDHPGLIAAALGMSSDGLRALCKSQVIEVDELQDDESNHGQFWRSKDSLEF